MPSDAEFPFNEERVIPDGVNRDSAIIGGKMKYILCFLLQEVKGRFSLTSLEVLHLLRKPGPLFTLRQ